jgi:hypothetical protein
MAVGDERTYKILKVLLLGIIGIEFYIELASDSTEEQL